MVNGASRINYRLQPFPACMRRRNHHDRGIGRPKHNLSDMQQNFVTDGSNAAYCTRSNLFSHFYARRVQSRLGLECSGRPTESPSDRCRELCRAMSGKYLSLRRLPNRVAMSDPRNSGEEQHEAVRLISRCQCNSSQPAPLSTIIAGVPNLLVTS